MCGERNSPSRSFQEVEAIRERETESLNRVCAVHPVKVFQPVLSFSVFTEYDEHER